MDPETSVADTQDAFDADIEALKAEDGNVDVAKLKALIAERNQLAATNPKLYERAKRLEHLDKQLKEGDESKKLITNEPNDALLKDISELKLAEQKRQFGYENGLSPEETDKVYQMSNNKPTKEILEDDFVKAGLNAIRAKKRVAENTPTPSGRSVTVKGKQFGDLSRDDKIENFGDYMAKTAGQSK